MHTNWTSSIKTFAEAPLTLCKLTCATANIIRRGISQNIFQCVCLADVLTFFSNHNYQLGFVIAAIVFERKFWDNCRRRIWVCERGRGLHEDGWQIWDSHFNFVCMFNILQELANASYYPESHLLHLVQCILLCQLLILREEIESCRFL